MSDRLLRIILIPDASESRSYEIGYRRLRILRGLALGLGVVLAFVVATWGYMAARVAHVVELEAQVAALQAERARFPALIRPDRRPGGPVRGAPSAIRAQGCGGPVRAVATAARFPEPFVRSGRERCRHARQLALDGAGVHHTGTVGRRRTGLTRDWTSPSRRGHIFEPPVRAGCSTSVRMRRMGCMFG